MDAARIIFRFVDLDIRILRIDLCFNDLAELAPRPYIEVDAAAVRDELEREPWPHTAFPPSVYEGALARTDVEPREYELHRAGRLFDIARDLYFEHHRILRRDEVRTAVVYPDLPECDREYGGEPYRCKRDEPAHDRPREPRECKRHPEKYADG